MWVSTPGGEAAPDHVVVSRWDAATWGSLGGGVFHPWLDARRGGRPNGITIAANALMRALHPGMNDDSLVPGERLTLLSISSIEVAIDLIRQLDTGAQPASWRSVELIRSTGELSLRELCNRAYDYATHATTIVEGAAAALQHNSPGIDSQFVFNRLLNVQFGSQ